MERERLAEIGRLVAGATVSVDVSTGDHDAGARVYGRVYSVQEDGTGDPGFTLLAEVLEDNRREHDRERLARHLYIRDCSHEREAAEHWDAGRVSRTRMEQYRSAADRALAALAGQAPAATLSAEDQVGRVRDALRQAGFAIDQVAGDDPAELIRQYDTKARGLVARLGGEAEQLRDTKARMSKALERIAAAATSLAEAANRQKLPTTERLWRGIATEALNALKEK